MDQAATSVRSHCLSPARARVAIDALLGPATYARMFPELPAFQADQQFLHALGNLLSNAMNGVLHRNRAMAWIATAFGLFVALLAMIGVYGVTAHATAERTREIGIRMALGAEPGDVNRMIMYRGIKLASIGAAIGLAGALALASVIRSLLFEVAPADPMILGAVTLLLFATVAAACWIPGRRAMRVDPMTALRQE